MQVGIDVKYMHTNFSGFGFFRRYCYFSNLVNYYESFLSLPPPLSSPPPPPPTLLTDYITGSLVSLNDVTISLQPHTDLQMTNTRTLH